MCNHRILTCLNLDNWNCCNLYCTISAISAISGPSFAAHLQVDAKDFLQGSLTNIRVTLTPLTKPAATGTYLVGMAPKSQYTDTNGATNGNTADSPVLRSTSM